MKKGTHLTEQEHVLRPHISVYDLVLVKERQCTKKIMKSGDSVSVKLYCRFFCNFSYIILT